MERREYELLRTIHKHVASSAHLFVRWFYHQYLHHRLCTGVSLRESCCRCSRQRSPSTMLYLLYGAHECKRRQESAKKHQRPEPWNRKVLLPERCGSDKGRAIHASTYRVCSRVERSDERHSLTCTRRRRLLASFRRSIWLIILLAGRP